MDRIGSLYVIACLLLVACVKENVGLNCWSCNSNDLYDGQGCGDPFTSNPNPLWNDTCTEGKFTGCRKIVQDVVGDYRIVRQCANEGNKEPYCVERAGTKGIKLRFCYCSGDRCNTATVTALSTLVTIIMAVSVAQFF